MKSRLLAIARTRFGGFLLRAALSAAPGLLPVHVCYRSSTLLAFRHPSPSYAGHILLLPLPPRRNLHALAGDGGAIFAEVLNAARGIATEQSFPSGWQLVVNAGAYQDVSILHFHLISDTAT